METKVCNMCKIEKTNSIEFFPPTGRGENLRNKCRECHNEYDKKRNAERKTYLKLQHKNERNCVQCGVIFEADKRCDKSLCDSCILKNKLIKEVIKQCEKVEKQRVKAEKEQRKQEQRELKLSKTKPCENCGKETTLTSNNMKYCPACRKKINNRKRELSKGRRAVKVKANGRRDSDISIEKLIKRDGCICYLCNHETSFHDHKLTPEGYFITGAKYPTVEHVIAIDNGGTHTWDNVKVACFECNSIKSNKELELILC